MATNSTPAAVKQKAYRAYQKLRQAMGVPTSTDQSEQRRGRRKTISDELA